MTDLSLSILRQLLERPNGLDMAEIGAITEAVRDAELRKRYLDALTVINPLPERKPLDTNKPLSGVKP